MSARAGILAAVFAAFSVYSVLTSAADLSSVEPWRVQVAQIGIGLKDAVAREMRRRENARNFKSTLNDPDDPFHALVDTPFAPYVTYYGGRDARKSWTIAEALIRRTNAMTRRVLCTRMYQNSIGDSVYRVLTDMIERLGLDHRFRATKSSIINRFTGSEFIFKGLQKPAELKSTEGIDDCWVAEAQDVVEDAWEILEPTIRKEGSQIIVDFNVTSEDTATYRRLVTNKPRGAVARLVNYTSNPFLSQRSRDRIEHLKKTDYDAYLHIYEGVPKKLSEALVFKHWRVEGFPDDLFMQAIRAGGRLFFGLDHGFAHDPYALIRYFILDRKLYIEYEAFGWRTEFAGQMKPGLNPGDAERGELEQLLDSVPLSREWPIKADSSRPETISFLKGKGFQVTAAEKWEGCVEDGIEWLKSFDAIIIHPRCRNMAEEARLYSFKVDKVTKQILPVLVDAHNHGWDAIRYGLDGYIQSGDLEVWAKLGA